MATLYLIDGYAQFFRAYHAIRTPMTSPVTGEPTNMTFGFVGMLLKLLSLADRSAGGDALAVAFDVSGDRGTFRSEIDPTYKATRPEPPEDLRPQVDRARGLLEAMGVPCLGVEGFEADDVIATIASSADRASWRVDRIRIVSRDKDLRQLLSADPSRGPVVEMYDIHTGEVLDEAGLRASAGVSPGQVVDMLTLMGDTVDNVRGVAGIGPKTAAELIASFGTLEAVLAEVADDGRPAGEQRIRGKRRESLAAAAAYLPRSRELITLRRDVPLAFDVDAARLATLRLASLEPILRELGFNRYRDELCALLRGGDAGEGGPSDVGASAASDGQGMLFGGSATVVDPVRVNATPTTARLVVTEGDLAELVGALRASGEFAFDTETTGVRPMRAELVGMSFAVREGEGWYVPVRGPEPDGHLPAEVVLGALRPVLEDGSRGILGHNLKFDVLVMRRAGVRLGGAGLSGVIRGGDGMVASYLIDASRASHGMDALALSLLGHECTPIRDLLRRAGDGRREGTFDRVPLPEAAAYAAEDADISLRLCRLMHPRLAEMRLESLYREIELPLVGVLADLESNGILVDPDELDRQRARLRLRLASIGAELRTAAAAAVGREIDPDSPRQIAEALFNAPDAAKPGLGLKPLKRTKTGYSTDAEVLERLTQDPAVTTPIPGMILEHRQLAKLEGTYLSALLEEIHPETGRIHASFNQTVAATGRLSSSDPNLQNIPIRTDVGREIRRAFVANRPGESGRVLITADYSQVELRLLAHLSGDAGLIAAFRSGADIHRAVAAEIHGVAADAVTREQRNGAKMVNFGIVYGITPHGLARRLGVGHRDAESIIERYRGRFPGITTFLDECVSFARRHGYVETMLGRRRPIPDIDSRNPSRRGLSERMAINSVVQGSAADLIKAAMVRLWRDLSAASGGASLLGNARLQLQIHDELVLEADARSAEAVRQHVVGVMRDALEGRVTLAVPLEVDAHISENWYDGK